MFSLDVDIVVSEHATEALPDGLSRQTLEEGAKGAKMCPFCFGFPSDFDRSKYGHWAFSEQPNYQAY